MPHTSEVADTVQCSFGSAAAVHSGFSISWQNRLKQSVCALLKTVVNDDIEVAQNLRVLITGIYSSEMRRENVGVCPCAKHGLIFTFRRWECTEVLNYVSEHASTAVR